MLPLSVYIPCYNGEKYIARCLESLLASDPAPDEILLIDDGSTDKTAEIAKRYPAIRLIQQEKNKGLGAARNRGLQEARNKFVASIDADVIVAKDWCAQWQVLLQEFPGAIIYGGHLEETVKVTLGDQWRCKHMQQNQGRRAILNPYHVCGSITLVDRKVILGLGGFDERMRANGEDCNICHRVRSNGGMIVYDQRPQAFHLREDTLKSALHTHWAWYRHPWVILFPIRTWRALYDLLRVRLWHNCMRALRADWRDKDWPMMFISLLSLPHHTWKEVRAFLRQRR
ncbi:MAG: glycosyltransferase [Alphaproteobacteria bacterium]|nr:glycosyltransferase [Alphaproteobacteria bacterium]